MVGIRIAAEVRPALRVLKEYSSKITCCVVAADAHQHARVRAAFGSLSIGGGREKLVQVTQNVIGVLDGACILVQPREAEIGHHTDGPQTGQRDGKAPLHLALYR